MKTRKEINDILIDMQNGKICIGTACDLLQQPPKESWEYCKCSDLDATNRICNHCGKIVPKEKYGMTTPASTSLPDEGEIKPVFCPYCKKESAYGIGSDTECSNCGATWQS